MQVQLKTNTNASTNNWATEECFEHFYCPGPVLAMILPTEQYIQYSIIAKRLNEGREQTQQSKKDIEDLQRRQPDASIDCSDNASQKLRHLVNDFGKLEHENIFLIADTVREIRPDFEVSLEEHRRAINTSTEQYWENFWQSQFNVSRADAREKLNAHEPGLANSLESLYSTVLDCCSDAIHCEKLETKAALSESLGEDVYLAAKMDRINAGQLARDVGRAFNTTLIEASNIFNPVVNINEFTGRRLDLQNTGVIPTPPSPTLQTESKGQTRTIVNIYGAPGAGKTHLAQLLAKELGAAYVPEYASHLIQTGKADVLNDQLATTGGQAEWLRSALDESNLVVSDSPCELDMNPSNEQFLIAAFHGDTETLQSSIDAGLNPNIRDGNGVTPLMLAAHSTNEGAITLLLQSGADVNTVDNEGRTARDWLMSSVQSCKELFSEITQENRHSLSY